MLNIKTLSFTTKKRSDDTVRGLPQRLSGRENLPANAGDMGSIPRWGRSLGEENGKLPQYPCLENLMDRGARRATVHRVTQSRTGLKRLITHACTRCSKAMRTELGLQFIKMVLGILCFYS